MADIYYPNKAPASALDWFSHMWFLTRCLLKAGWRSMASSDGSTKETTGGDTACKWGTSLAVPSQTGVAASIGAAVGKDFVFTGLTGLVSPTRANQGGSEGNYLLISGAASGGNNAVWQISKVISASSCNARPLITTGVASDANSGSITWTERSALTTAYSAMANGAWIVLRGPSILKIAFTTAPTGVFLRGENISQATTGAEGEVLGVTFEPTTGIGWMVVAPRVSGSGADARGWNHSNVVTGAKSSATFTPSAGPIDYVREVMIMRGTTLFAGTIYYAALDVSGESASLYTTLAASAGCTATIPPGGGGTANAFPATGCYVVTGTGGSVSHTTSAWVGTNYATTNTIGNLQVFAANCLERSTISQDGSWCTALGQPVASTQSAGSTPMFQRLDNGEEGDVEPYAWYAPSDTNTVDARSRTAAATSGTGAEAWIGASVFEQNTGNAWVSIRRRGLSSEAFLSVHPGLFTYRSIVALAVSTNSTDPEKVSSSAQTTAPLVLEPMFLGSYGTGTKVRKGSPRYIFCINGNVGYDTFGAKQWLSPGPPAVGTLNGLSFVMPYDGSTVPVQ